MLSNKMTVSLMSLITIIALAFVAPSAMAAEFGVSLDMTDDVSTIDGLQLINPHERPNPSNVLWVRVLFVQAVDLAAVKDTEISVSGFDAKGNYIPLVGLVPVGPNYPDGGVTPITASRNFWLHIRVARETTQVKLKINKGIASDDPFNDDTSKELNTTINLVQGDRGAPSVYSIARTDNPLLKATADTLQIIVTLSERAKAFTKDHISVTNADVTAVTALDPVPEITAITAIGTARVTDALQGGTPPVLRGLIDGIDRNGRTYDIGASIETTDGIHTALLKAEESIALTQAVDGEVQPVDNTADTPLRVAARAYNNAILMANNGIATGDIDDDTPAGADNETGVIPLGAVDAGYDVDDASLDLSLYIPNGDDLPDPEPTLPMVLSEEGGPPTEVTVATGVADADADGAIPTLTFPNVDLASFPGTAPDPSDFASLADYQDHRQLWEYKSLAKDVYNAGMALREVYDQFVEDAMEADDMALEDYLTLTLTDPDDRQLIQRGTGRDDQLYPYVVTLKPKYPAGKPDIEVKVKEFEDESDPPRKYTPPQVADDYVEGRDILTIKVDRHIVIDLAAGTRLNLPHGEAAMIPADGFYLLTKNKDGSGINYSHEKDDENLSHRQTPAQLKFNVRAAGIPNLENLLLSGGTIDLVAYDGTAATAAYISEVMWGSDASQEDSSNSQWIEIANTTASAISIGENKWALWFYQAHETLPSSYTDTDGTTAGTLIDRIGTERSDTGVFWSVVGTAGQSGRTNVDPGGADVAAIAPTQPLVSMIRVTDTANAPVDGTLPTSWAATATGTSANFKLGIEGTRWATPGAVDIVRPTAPTPPAETPTVPVAGATDIRITEIMVDTDSGRLPQWIELTHVGTGEVSLDGWEMVIDNAIDADVIGGGNAITVSLGGATLDVSAHTGNTGKGQSVLVVAWAAPRHSANIRADRIINIATQLNQTRRYQLLSYKSFRVTLVPPQTGAIAAFGDVAGNLDEEWEIPMDEGTARSSMIRREMAGTPAAATMGTDANGWTLASSTPLVTGPPTYYGDDEDMGTPGQDAGGPLPVELSHFRPARDKQTGAVVITWATQSELNNAGFFIKRSNQRNGQFQVVNAAMIPGAGTTSEKQFYTYTDTTAQPNVVYYYQIEDVSLDGNRQTLTNGIRLKGHIGAAGKLTSTWGELKSSNE